MKGKWLLLLPSLVLICGLILAACGGSKESEPHRHGNENWEHETSYAQLPSFLDHYSGKTRHLYSIVGDYEHIMKLVNCYCGCMDYDDSHASLLRCYVVSKDDKGVTWTDHSGQCGICLEELEMIEQWSKEGKSPEQIVKLIEENFNPNAVV